MSDEQNEFNRMMSALCDDTDLFDFNFEPPTPEQQKQIDAKCGARLEARAQLRAENDKRPRCAGCGGDLLRFDDGRDGVTEVQLQDEGYDYLVKFDYRAGDLICFWCLNDMTNIGENFYWGRA